MKTKIKYITFILVISIPLMLFTNCNALLLPKKQKITFNTNSDENEIYLDNELVCQGKANTVKVNKYKVEGQINIVRKGHKTVYDVILRNRRPYAFVPLLILGLPVSPTGYIVDFTNLKCKSYNSKISINLNSEETLLPIKQENEKYLDLSNIRLNSNDIIYLKVNHTDNLIDELKKSEVSYLESIEKRGEKLKMPNENFKNQVLDSKFSHELLKTLKETKFIDTTNKVFNDQNNTLFLEASVNKIIYFDISTKWETFKKTKLNITWYLKNAYNEILDSVSLEDYSGNFSFVKITIYNSEKIHENKKKEIDAIGDALLNSYLNLSRKNTFKDKLKNIQDLTIKDDQLRIDPVSNECKIINKKDAYKATVIVKAKENKKNVGHGSGFAISKDGYVLTNYHVIAGKTANKQNEISVITATGQELPAKIVRFNKFRDVALLKIDYAFEKVFELENKNKAEVMMDVLTIGAPKSIELGQSVTTGIISNIRNENENKYLQLNMSINGGNSGGPIFDEQGNLHGIVVSKLVGYATEGVGFAIPSYMVAEYLNLNVK